MKPINTIVVCVVCCLFLSAPWAVSDTAQSVQDEVGAGVNTLKKTQVRQDLWESEKAALISDYIRLTREKQVLDEEHQALARQAAAQKAMNQDLTREKIESIRVLKELPRFLATVLSRISALVEADPPFLKPERNARILALHRMLPDPSVSWAEKYRKIMEALFIEAEYGATIEVCQEKILLEGGEQPLVNIFRLGRVSLFFLTLDQEVCGVFTPSLNRWQVLDPDHLPAIRAAVDIGTKRRPAELLPLPLGRLSRQGGDG